MRLKFIFLTSLIFSVFLINVPAEVANYYLESNSYSKNYNYKPDDEWAPKYKHFTKEAMPGDFFGDGVIPERFVLSAADPGRWDGKSDGKDNKVQAEFEIISLFSGGPNPAQDYQLENTGHDPGNENSLELAKRKTWHETYENAFGISGRPYYINEDGNLELTKNIKDPSGGHFNLTSRTPMRGIIPFWEYTNKFNEYVLSITDNGSTDAPELGYDENYSEFINTYVGSPEQTNSPFYKYLENPELIEEKFNLDDPFGMLPSDYQLIRDEGLNKDGTLTNAFISIDYNNGTAYGLMSYLSDFMIGNGNTNIQENKVINKGDFPKLEPREISVSAPGGRYSGFDIENANEENKSKKLEEIDIGEIMFVFAGDDLENVNDNEGSEALTFNFTRNNESIDEKMEGDYFPSYRGEYSESSILGENSHQYRQFNPLEKQMNAYDIDKTEIQTIDKSSFDKFIKESKDKYYIETEFKSFKNDFEDGLINSRDGINSEFIKYYDTNHVGYYSNLSEDGTKFLGRNRFQSGFYPVEDIRIDDLNITYTDQEGNAISDNTLLGDIESINIDISPNTSSEAVNILFNLPTDTQETLHFDTSRLVSINPAIPPTPDNNNGLSPMTIGLIVGIAGAVILIGAVIAIGVVKKK